MANIVQIKRSSVAGKQPNVADLQVGELAINLADAVLYSKDTSGNIISLGSASSSLTFSNTQPSSPSSGDVWIDSDSGNYYTYFNDGTSAQWVEIAASAVYTSNSAGGGGGTDLTGNTTTDLAEGNNLYFTNNRVETFIVDAGYQTAANILANVFSSGINISGNSIDDLNDVVISTPTSGQVLKYNGANWVNAAESGGGGDVDLTSVSSNILPDTDITYDIGSPSLRFKDLYLSGNTINLGNALIQADATTGAVLIIPTPTDENPNPKATLVSPSGSITAVETTGGTVNTASITNISNTTSDAFYLNSNTITSNVTIPTGKNAMSAGPITIAANIEVTVSSGSEWTVV